jgi:uncharacterized protein YceH (UPF0502 family)
VLILRGPQTAAELRLNTSRLHDFADISSVEVFLDELAANEPPRVVKLPRTPGERENRWMHLLCGEVSISEEPSRGVAEDSVPSAEIEALAAEVKRQGEELVRLQTLVEHMAAELGNAASPAGPQVSRRGSPRTGCPCPSFRCSGCIRRVRP